MNTISSNLKDEIKKSHDSKKKDQLKFIAGLLVTNILVAILCLPSSSPKAESPRLTKTLHVAHQMMVIPLEALISESAGELPETPVSIISKDKKVIAEKAFLHEEAKSVNGVSHFKIEISNKDVLRMSEYLEEGMVAVPYVENKKSKTLRRSSKYEVSI